MRQENHPLTALVKAKTSEITPKVLVRDCYGKHRYCTPMWSQGDWCVRSYGLHPLSVDDRGDFAITSMFARRRS